jgi:multidrug resistance efflux pump
LGKSFLYLFFAAVALASCQQPTQETKPVRQNVIETVFASGILEARNTYNLTAQNDGYLLEVYFEEGDLVKKGQMLARIENRENALNAENASKLYDIAVQNAEKNAPAIRQAQIAVQTAQQKMEQDRAQAERYQRLWKRNSIAKSEYETAVLNFETAKNNHESALQALKKLETDAAQQTVAPQNQQKINQVILEKNTIRAVESGKIYQKFKQKGDFVRRGDVIASIGDPDFIYAKINVDENSIAKVKIGQKALVQINAQKSKPYQAEVMEILPTFDEAQQSFVCKLKFTETLDFSIVKTQLQANITVDTQRNALLIPRVFLEYGGFVFVKNGKEKEKRKVETQFVSNEWVQVLSGIDENTVLTTTNMGGGSSGNFVPSM